MFLAFWLFRPTCQQEAIWSIFWSTWPSTWHQKSTKNPLERLLTSIKKGIENKMQVAMGFGALLERFCWILGPSWEASWDQVGSKIDHKSIKERCWKKVSKLLPKKSCRRLKSYAGREGVGPLKSINPDLPGTHLGITHSSRALKARWRICICICICICVCTQGCANSPPQRLGTSEIL